MIDLAGKTAVVFGLANKRSIAWGIAQKLHEAGATLAICYQNERMKLEAEDLIEELPGASGFQCDVSSDTEIDAALRRPQGEVRQARHPRPRRRLCARRRSARRIHQHQPRRLPRRHGRQRLLAHRRQPRRRAAHDRRRQHHDAQLLRRRKSRAQLQRHGRGQGRHSNPPSATSPANLGSKNIRVNAISAGPIKTLAARGVGDLSEMMRAHAERAPLHRNVDQLEVGGVALFLASDLSSAITGEIIYVDCGYNIMGF